jgi:cysteinyl-tRNA synthetase
MSKIVLFNTLTRQKEEFVPLVPGKVGMYTCGPTVYQYASIGNMRSYVFSDVLRRVLEYNGLKVKMVMNITDVGHLVSDADEGEDKMVVAVNKEKKTPYQIADHYTKAFFKDIARLNIKRPTLTPAATDHIQDMIEMVLELVDKGHAYETSDGIYFDISTFPSYGRLSCINLEDLKAGARVKVNLEKRHHADFAVWKKAPKEHIMQWESPWGMGYPGWHIECSAMSRKYLGDQFDIHTGGVDHISIHHENEIAQSQACSGEVPARYWMHGEFLTVDGGKMSKSLGNTYLVEDLIEKGFEPLAFRYFCFSAHYRTRLNFTWDALTGAQNGLLSLRTAIQKAKDEIADSGISIEARVSEFKESFREAIKDDLNIPKALAILWEATRANLGSALVSLAAEFDKVLALDLCTGETKDSSLDPDMLPEEVKTLIKERLDARARKDWAMADSLRAKINEMGYSVKDTPDGYEVTRIR